MKGYRRLAPGEVMREGDLILASDRFIYRKARTDGCPPGWRWADKGEGSEYWYEHGFVDRIEPVTVRDDCRKRGFVVSWPEDPRLLGENKGEKE